MIQESEIAKTLRAGHYDLDRQVESYYSGGMENPCRLIPENVLFFFMRHTGLSKDTPVNCHHRYQIKINLGPESIFGIDELRFRMPADSGILIFPFQLHYVALGDASKERHHLTISFSDRGNGGNR